MRIKQASVSSGVASFATRFLSKYKLIDYHDPSTPLVMFGMYNEGDYKLFTTHKAPIIVVWCGTDSLKINRSRIRILQRKRHVTHYAMSSYIGDDLKAHDISHTILPITPSTINIDPQPRGEAIYCYGLRTPAFYNIELAKEVSRITGHQLILAQHDTFSQSELIQAYKDSFIGLRLTPHDGLPNTVLELGMMGRRSIYNGNIPHSIKWKGLNDICESVEKEYQNREQPNAHISKDIKKYLDISEDWLNIKFHGRKS